jgi:hypothetical protein
MVYAADVGAGLQPGVRTQYNNGCRNADEKKNGISVQATNKMALRVRRR